MLYSEHEPNKAKRFFFLTKFLKRKGELIMFKAKDISNISTEVNDVNDFFNKLKDAYYTSRLMHYVTYKTTVALQKEEREVADLFKPKNPVRAETYTADKISEKCYVVTNTWYNNHEEHNLYFPYYGQSHVVREGYFSYETAAIAALLFDAMGECPISEGIISTITGILEDGRFTIDRK